MTRTLGLMAIVGFALTACGGKDDTGATATGGTNADPCEGKTFGEDDIFPAVNATDVYYRTSIDFDMGDFLEADATIKVTTGGAEVAGATAVEGTRVVFTPDAPLEASTTYDVELGWSCGPTANSFTTSGIGAQADGAGLVGNAYALNLSGGRFVEPAGVGDLIGSFLTQDVLLGVTEFQNDELFFMGALGMEGGGGQDMCQESFDFPVGADFTGNPYFLVESELLPLTVADVSVEISNLEVSGAFAEDGSSIQGAVLMGTLDVTVLGDLLGGDACSMLVGFGLSCIPCPNDPSNVSCLSIHVDNMTADQEAGGLVPRTAQDIECDKACGGPAKGVTCP